MRTNAITIFREQAFYSTITVFQTFIIVVYDLPVAAHDLRIVADKMLIVPDNLLPDNPLVVAHMLLNMANYFLVVAFRVQGFPFKYKLRK